MLPQKLFNDLLFNYSPRLFHFSKITVITYALEAVERTLTVETNGLHVFQSSKEGGNAKSFENSDENGERKHKVVPEQ